MTLHVAISREKRREALLLIFHHRVSECYITNLGSAGDGGQCREIPRVRPPCYAGVS